MEQTMFMYQLVNPLFVMQPRRIVQSFPMTIEIIQVYAQLGWRVIPVDGPSESEYHN